jgi:redox-sensitive bicupin YhaK (pirin superfamily)
MPTLIAVNCETGEVTTREAPATPEYYLFATPSAIAADGQEVAVVSYVTTDEDTPAQVTFNINGVAATEALVDGTAAIEVTAVAPGPIVINCEGLEATIQAEEV